MLAVSFQNKGILSFTQCGLYKNITQLCLQSRVEVDFWLLHCQAACLGAVRHHKHRKDLRNSDPDVSVRNNCVAPLVDEHQFANAIGVRIVDNGENRSVSASMSLITGYAPVAIVDCHHSPVPCREPLSWTSSSPFFQRSSAIGPTPRGIARPICKASLACLSRASHSPPRARHHRGAKNPRHSRHRHTSWRLHVRQRPSVVVERSAAGQGTGAV